MSLSDGCAKGVLRELLKRDGEAVDGPDGLVIEARGLLAKRNRK